MKTMVVMDFSGLTFLSVYHIGHFPGLNQLLSMVGQILSVGEQGTFFHSNGFCLEC